MTDRDLVAKKLARIATCLHELRTMASADRLGEDVRERRFVAARYLFGVTGFGFISMVRFTASPGWARAIAVPV